MKEKLNACVTMQDSYDLFKSLDTDVLKDFVDTLKKAKTFIDLTMRDDFFYSQAKLELDYRDGLVGRVG